MRHTELDIWHDDEGVWRQDGATTLGPFKTEVEAEMFQQLDAVDLICRAELTAEKRSWCGSTTEERRSKC